MRDRSAHHFSGSQLQNTQEQYRDDRRLESRYNVHKNFSTARINYLDWIFEHLSRQSIKSLLDLGCGPGYLWQHNIRKVPSEWSLILGDRSEGMLLTAAENLPSIASQIEYVNLKAEQLPFRSGQIDTVLTLHVLHHLDDLNIVLTEIKRVLSPGGMLFAATNGNRHMLQFRDALELCGVNPEYFKSVMGFSLQEGELKLLELFDHVECTHFQDTLEVTRVSPLLNYARSGMPDEQLDEQVDALGRLEHHWKEELDRKGVIQIEKQTGLFLAK